VRSKAREGKRGVEPLRRPFEGAFILGLVRDFALFFLAIGFKIQR